MVVVVGKKDGDVVVPSSVDVVTSAVSVGVVVVKNESVVVAPLSVDASVDVASGDAVASVVLVVVLAGTNDANATELNKPTTTKTATAAARRVFFSCR